MSTPDICEVTTSFSGTFTSSVFDPSFLTFNFEISSPNLALFDFLYYSLAISLTLPFATS